MKIEVNSSGQKNKDTVTFGTVGDLFQGTRDQDLFVKNLVALGELNQKIKLLKTEEQREIIENFFKQLRGE